MTVTAVSPAILIPLFIPGGFRAGCAFRGLSRYDGTHI